MTTPAWRRRLSSRHPLRLRVLLLWAVVACAGASWLSVARLQQFIERVVPTGNKASGLGLGLHIVREIVVAHQGTIGVESEIGSGAKFTIELPTHAMAM